MELKIRDSVLRVISDDYESVEIILRGVQRIVGVAPTQEQIHLALEELVDEGLAQAYELSPHQPQATPVDINPDEIEELWFYATPKGIDIVRRWNLQLTTDN